MSIKMLSKFRKKDQLISKRVIRLGLPVILSNLSRTFMNLADMAMVGHLGVVALAAVGMGAMLVWTIMSFGISLRTATQTVASRRLGQKRWKACGAAMHNGHLLAAAFGIPVALGGYYFADKFVPFFLSDPEVVRLCIDYTSVAFLSVLFSSIGFVFQGFFTGIERTRIHMNVTVLANALNVYLNVGLIYGSEGIESFLAGIGSGGWSWVGVFWGWASFPSMGVKGAALATLIASTWMAIHYSLYLVTPWIRKKFGVFSLRIDGEMLKRQIRLALPQGSQEMLVMFGFALFYKIVGMIGTLELAATEIVFTILQTSFMPAAGIGQACATLVGKFLGEKNPEKAEISIVESVRWALIIMGSLGAIFFFIPRLILPIFTSDPEVIKFGVFGLRVAGLVQLADAVGMTLWFALSGAGNTFYPAVVESGIMWLFFLPAAYLTGIVLGMGFFGPWICMGIYLVLFAAFMAQKILKGDWKEIEL
jgi:putative MATE family efflux protein